MTSETLRRGTARMPRQYLWGKLVTVLALAVLYLALTALYSQNLALTVLYLALTALYGQNLALTVLYGQNLALTVLFKPDTLRRDARRGTRTEAPSPSASASGGTPYTLNPAP